MNWRELGCVIVGHRFKRMYRRKNNYWIKGVHLVDISSLRVCKRCGKEKHSFNTYKASAAPRKNEQQPAGPPPWDQQQKINL